MLYAHHVGTPPDITLSTPISHVPGVTEKAALDLRTLGITRLGHLIAHLPARFERQSAESRIKDLAEGQIGSARGEVTATRPVRGRKPRFEAVLIDATGRLDLVWFNMPYVQKQIHPGMRLWVQGKLAMHNHYPQMVNPKFEVIREGSREPGLRDERLRPVYPASERMSSERLERLMSKVLAIALPRVEDHLSEAYCRERNMPTLREAYRMQHAPASEEEVRASRRRLAYDELLLLQLGVQMKRAHLRRGLKSPALRWTGAIDSHIRERFPFKMTPEQDEVIRDLVTDLTSDRPTNRLIQGDVGSGKTAVALYAMLMAVASRHQALLMAPTEILAEQHCQSISDILRDSRVAVRLLTGATSERERGAMLEELAAGKVDVLIGTHALLNEGVRFKSLAVAIIDEQHRFGVGQRARLREKSTTKEQVSGEAGRTGAREHERTPHVIVMTATPIPRTMALTLFGDLDISTIRGLPPGRKAIRTALIPPDRRDEVYERMDARIADGEQAYVVVPVIEPIEGEPVVQSVRAMRTQLEQTLLPGRRIGEMHGDLDRAARDEVMRKFRGGEIDVLLATTMIEVGVNVPNATMMVIENAERFGLAQLHQLRGRVGRGSRESACVLIADPADDEARARLAVPVQTSDGFALAEKDLELRGPGEVFGLKQSGLPPFKVADLMRDRDLLALARRDAAAWIERSPALDHAEEKILLRRLLKTYGHALALGDVG
jgi:ATP-dependent DNA helicase RecG